MAVNADTPARRRLVAELRRVKQESGLSFARLQAHTPYSRSSLERYVNGKLFPTRQAVAEIARACGADVGELLTMWDTAAADDAAKQRTEQPRRSRRLRFALVVAIGLLVPMVVLLNGDQYAPLATSASASHVVAPTAAPPEIWSRRLSVLTTDSTKTGWLEATLDWRGSGPFDGRIYGSVHARDGENGCAIAYAWYDGKVTEIGHTCAPQAGGAVSDEFRHTWRALVQVCLRRATAPELRWCSEWS